jgi:transcriptional regulator with XRE-family HTH domain
MAQTRLKQLREEAVMTVHELAKASDVSDDTISKIENGQRVARPSTLRKLAHALGVSPQELRLPAKTEEPTLAGKAEAPEEAGPARKPRVPLYDDARKGIEMFCDHWEHVLETGDLNRQSLEELRVGINSFNPVVDALVDAELRDLSRRHHEVTGEPLVYGPLALQRKFGDKASLAPAVDRYIGVCLKAMRARAQEAGADPEQDADVISLEERRKTLHSKAS